MILISILSITLYEMHWFFFNLSFRTSKGIIPIADTILIFATIHYSYGLGFLLGYLKRMLEVTLKRNRIIFGG